ncbi:hypothetical protein [Rhizosphaericola mali]|uniref:Beta-lactamase-inhibitor-like PepSY-like domain-containing protein n=1 Tax=Rhizosphaericola mali TaxID=2545455 RepID=A0A5P2G3Q2_9BACT|nr:hypothetical protein [Rhizosphaericola mali]QES88440.1 hypothetical protein E0W69_007120 [Rhizosphaericola mali]
MKKLLIIAAAFIAISLQVSANSSNKTKDDKDDSINVFVHSNASKIVWHYHDNFDIATFTKDGYLMKAYYDAQGNMVSTTRALKNRNELPMVVLNNLDKQYPGWGMTDLFEENGLDKEMVYYAKVTDGDRSLILKITPKGRISKF